MTAPQWLLIALPLVSIVAVVIAGLYSNIKVLLEIKKLTLETERLRRDLAERDNRIHRPTDDELRQFLRESKNYLHSLADSSERISSLSDSIAATSRNRTFPVTDDISNSVRSAVELLRENSAYARDLLELVRAIATNTEIPGLRADIHELNEQVAYLSLAVQRRAPRA